MQTTQKNNQLTLFSSQDGNITIDVRVENETVWLTQKQIGQLFGKERSVITKHINNIFKEKEVDESNVQNLHIPNSDKPVAFYNLDVIISVGYRVKSKRGIEFRSWANKVLKDYLLKGYALNQNLINAKSIEYQSLLDLLSKTLINNQLISDTGSSVLSIINNYANTWSSLLQYDEDRLSIPDSVHKDSNVTLEYSVAKEAITKLKNQLILINEASVLFGNEKEAGLESILGNLEQTMFGESLYKSIEEKAANLLYMVIKDHPFSDGNKRIGSFLFLLYLKINKLPLTLNSNGLIALALLIAESNPIQKDLMVKLIINLLVK